MTDIVKRIEKRRKDLGISANRMCKEAGVPVTSYSNYLHRGGEPNREALKEIARVLQTTVIALETGSKVSARLQDEMESLTHRVAALKPSEQDRVIAMMSDIVAGYEGKR